MEIIDDRDRREYLVDEEMEGKGYRAYARYQAKAKAIKEAREFENDGRDVQLRRVGRSPNVWFDFAYKLYLR